MLLAVPAYLLDIVVAQCAAIFELLAGEDKTLLVRWDAFLVLDLGLDVVDGVGRLHLEGDGLAREGLDEDLHWRKVSDATAEGKTVHALVADVRQVGV